MGEVFTTEILRQLYDVETMVMTIKEGEAERLICFPQDVCLPAGA